MDLVHGPGPRGGPWTPVNVLYTSASVIHKLVLYISEIKYPESRVLVMRAMRQPTVLLSFNRTPVVQYELLRK